MSISIRARRTAIVSFAVALIAASCALPEYEVGESSSGTTATGSTATGSTATAGGSQTSSSSTGGAGGAGGEGQGGAGGGDGGAGGSNIPECPELPPKPGSPCSWPKLQCTYPSAGGKSCCDDEFKCFDADPMNPTWELIAKEVNCGPMGCPLDCSPMCLAEPPPPLGCFCRVEMPLVCNYNHCVDNGSVQQVGCAPPVNPGGKNIWKNMGAHLCCNPGAPQQCPGCATHEDVNNQPVSFCP